jgi:hypothetical protein
VSVLVSVSVLGVLFQTSGAPLTSGAGTHTWEWPEKEENRPDVFIVNNAAAYAAWYQVRSCAAPECCVECSPWRVWLPA